MTTQPHVRMKAVEFLALPEATQPTELIEGEVVVSPAPTPKHQRTNRRTVLLLERLIPNGEIFYAPIDVYLDEDNVPQPDIVWVAADSRCIVSEKLLKGPPDLVIEIFSPGTVRQDKITKFKLYEKHGVREYWTIDPEEEYLDVFVLREGKFARQGTYSAGDKFESEALGKRVDVSAIFSA
jgi:Uma2 family endonuclease